MAERLVLKLILRHCYALLLFYLYTTGSKPLSLHLLHQGKRLLLRQLLHLAARAAEELAPFRVSITVFRELSERLLLVDMLDVVRDALESGK